MRKNKKRLIFLVDDDALYLKSLELEFIDCDEYEVMSFATGELCVESLKYKPEIVVLDYLLDEVDKTAMNGLKTLDKIKAYNEHIQVIILSAQDKIEVAVNCMKHNAFDYIVKSETAHFRLKKVIYTIFKNKKLEDTLNWYMDNV
jgi:two-component system, OmpR family, response regulator